MDTIARGTAVLAFLEYRPIDYDSRQINNLVNDSAIKLIQFDRIVR